MSEDRQTTGFNEPARPALAQVSGEHAAGIIHEPGTGGLPAEQHHAAPPALAGEFDDVSGAGLENARQEEMRPSFLYLLAPNSKAVMRGHQDYIPGAEAGMFRVTGSDHIYKQIEMVPLGRSLKYLEWKPLQDDKGNTLDGGFVGEHSPDSDFVQGLRTPENRFKKIRSPTGNDLIQTFELWALVGAPGFTLEQAELVTFPFTSIKIKMYTTWFEHVRKIKYANSAGKLVVPDIYYHRWLVKSEFEQKWKPNGAWNVRIDIANLTEATGKLPWGDPNRTLPALLRRNDPLREEARKLYEMIVAGTVRADYSKAEAENPVERQPGEDDDGPLPF